MADDHEMWDAPWIFALHGQESRQRLREVTVRGCGSPGRATDATHLPPPPPPPPGAAGPAPAACAAGTGPAGAQRDGAGPLAPPGPRGQPRPRRSLPTCPARSRRSPSRLCRRRAGGSGESGRLRAGGSSAMAGLEPPAHTLPAGALALCCVSVELHRAPGEGRGEHRPAP